MAGYTMSAGDREILRALAQELRADAELPIQAERRKLWTAHNDLKTGQPLIFCDPENGWHEIITDDMLKSICVPTFVTAGEKDVIKPEHTRHIAETVPGAVLKIYPKTGHSGYIMNSTRIADYILSALKGETP